METKLAYASSLMRSWTVVAQYIDFETAKQAMDGLLKEGYPAGSISWAVHSATGDTQLSLIIIDQGLAEAIQIFQEYDPRHLSVREIDVEQSKGVQVIYLNHEDDNIKGLANQD